ncbi:MAG TPA: enterotoxin [Terracidiphilus sp.]|nr:enterotoxin [Terracidiphilus sp.]
MAKATWMAVCALTVASMCSAGAQTLESGPVRLTQTDDGYALGNAAMEAVVRLKDGRLSGLAVSDRLHSTEMTEAEPFAIQMQDGRVYLSTEMKLAGEASTHALAGDAGAARMAEGLKGEEVTVPLETADGALRAEWRVVMRDGGNYVREVLTLTAVGKDAAIGRLELLDVSPAGAHVSGTVKGSPVVAGNWFMGFEDPLSESRVSVGRATAWVDRELPLKAGQSITYSAVVGVARTGQMRRDFLAYLERERAHPYRTFLHYNSWYDMGNIHPYDAKLAVNRVNAFGEELTRKRGVEMNSFLFDDGWDNHHSLWKFNSGFPDGFTPVRKAAERIGAEPGVWMSPWGGYETPKQERIAFAKSAGYEVVDGGYALSGPKYYAAFRDVCLEMMKQYGVNQFKFDGTGNVNSVFPGSRFDSDFAAMMHLIGEIRAAKSDAFINVTTGTWPSPFWLRYADSTWRGGDDTSVTGVGSYRERWITFRDEQTYRNIVERGPLYPLNSLMLHGIVYAQLRKGLSTDPGNDFRNEVRSYFGTGTQLQELYITPDLLTKANWDDLAEAAKWSRANEDVLKDTHWVGGDPGWLEAYGWASWTPRMGILVLRNPSDKPQTIRLRLADSLELPAGAAEAYEAKSPWKSDAGQPALELDARQEHAFRLAPFEVLTLNLTPKQRGAK